MTDEEFLSGVGITPIGGTPHIYIKDGEWGVAWDRPGVQPTFLWSHTETVPVHGRFRCDGSYTLE